MRTSLGLPTPLTLAPGAPSVGDLAAEAEAAGVDAVHVTDHPAPDDAWLAAGGHTALDPLVALAFAAAATSTVLLHTNLLVAPYRHPWLTAHGAATLDRLSGGRLVMGVGAGHLEAEMDVLGVDPATRGDRTDEVLALCRRLWAGEVLDGRRLHPLPAREGGPPIWVGGNSGRAARRAAELGDGWSPFPTRRTTLDDLAAGIAHLDACTAAAGRTEPLEVAYMVPSLMMGRARPWSADEVLAQCTDLAALGVAWLVLVVDDTDVATWRAQLDRVRTELVPALAALDPAPRTLPS